jgi:putative transposase
MPTGLSRRYGQGHLHFITCSCYRRLPLLESVQARNNFVRILGEVRERFGFALVGYVVMPNHVHLLISEPAKGTPSTVLQVLKQRVSKRLRPRPRRRASAGQLRLRFDGEGDSLPQFWQARFYDFNVWSQKKKLEKLQYMHMNPIKRKLVSHPKEWPWSSFSFYSGRKAGLIRIDPVN